MARHTPIDLTIYYLSESAVTLQFGEMITPEAADSVNVHYKKLLKYPFPGFVSAVLAYNTLSIFFDPMKVIAEQSMFGIDCFEKVSAYLQYLSKLPIETVKNAINLVTIPVCYDDIYGPDLEDLAALHRMDTHEVIKQHSSASYTVGMIGFVPGFAYLTGLPDSLETPRKLSPRRAVPAGSVGIAGKQTGIYSLETPGGWQIIGRTPLTLFDAHRTQPSLLKNRDEVIFKPISAEEFEQITQTAHATARS